jgi:DNA-binding beta-propeller fold protein YncE
MTSPIGVCTDGGSKVFVADSNGQTVHVFDLDSRRYGRWEPPEKFGLPVALAWDGAGSRLLVSDSVAACVYAFDASGAMTAKLGAGALKRPAGIASDAGGRVFVADVGGAPGHPARQRRRGDHAPGRARHGSGHVQLPDQPRAGSPRPPVRQRHAQLPRAGLRARPQADPPDRAAGRPARLFRPAQGRGGRSRRARLRGGCAVRGGAALHARGAVAPVGRARGRGPGEFWLPAGIHIDAKGRVWIADSYNQRVQVFQYLRRTDGGTAGRAKHGAWTGREGGSHSQFVNQRGWRRWGRLFAAAGATAQVVSVVNSPHDLSAGSAAQRARRQRGSGLHLLPHAAQRLAHRAAVEPRHVAPGLLGLHQPLPGRQARASPPAIPSSASPVTTAPSRWGACSAAPRPIPMAGGVVTMPRARAISAPTLRDDHPISFQL